MVTPWHEVLKSGTELLRAYRKAHARNSLIEPFEATLREHTSTTSIADPGAFVEYLSQLNLKGDMVMDELKRVTMEKNAAREKLQAAVEETKAAWDEVAQLRQDKDAATAMASRVDGDAGKGPDFSNTLIVAGKRPMSESQDGAIAASPLDDSSQAGTATLFAAPSSTEVATPSSDERCHQLEKELHNASLQVERLETENAGLRKDLAEVQNEFVRTSEALRSAQTEIIQSKSVLETTQEVLRRTEQGLGQTRHELVIAQTELENVKTELDSGRTDFEVWRGGHNETVIEKNSKIEALEHMTADLTARLSATTSELNEQTARSERLQIDAEDMVQRRIREALITEQASREAISPQTNDLQKSLEGTDAAEEVHDSSKKKKSKKKKKKGAGTSAMSQDVTRPTSPINNVLAAHLTTNTTTADAIGNWQLRLDTYSSEIREKDASIQRLQIRLKAQDELLEEIEHLKDELLHIGQEHVEAKEKIKSLVAARASLNEEKERIEKAMAEQQSVGAAQEVLQGEIVELKLRIEGLEAAKAESEKQILSLEKDIASLGQSKASSDAALEEARQTLATELEELRSLNSALEADLSASQQLAAARFKELTNAREVLQRIQAECLSVKSELSTLKLEKSELNVTIAELRDLRAKEADLQSELDVTRHRMTERDQEYRSLDQRFNQESSRTSILEESTRRLQKDLQRAEVEKNEAVDARSRTKAELADVQSSANQSLSQVKRMEGQLEQLNKDLRSVKEQLDAQTARQAQVQSSLSGARDQAMEMATQMKEAKGRCESLEEELTDAHRLLHERGRESETMRRLLAELEGRTESRLKEMKNQLDLATQERDRAEDEASSVGRRRGREVEEVRSRLRDAERRLKSMLEDKSDLERVTHDIGRRQEEAEQRAQSAVQELLDVRKAMEDLKDALESGENQTRQLLKEKMDLTRSLEEAQNRVDRLQKSKEACYSRGL